MDTEAKVSTTTIMVLLVLLVLAICHVECTGGMIEDRILEPSVTIHAGVGGYYRSLAVRDQARVAAHRVPDAQLEDWLGRQQMLGTGSGVVFTRQGINYILTAGHVVAGLRSVKTRLRDGEEQKYETFRDAAIVKVLYEGERKVGKLEMDARVMAYSDAQDGEDLALLEVRKRGFIATSAVFRLTMDGLPIGTRLYHCGSLQGEMGSNSLTNGIISQIGRVYQGQIYDQTNCTAFPGSSGGGVFNTDGEYIGMVTRGAGETFVLYVPGRRILAWLRKTNHLWIVDPTLPKPPDAATAPVADGE